MPPQPQQLVMPFAPMVSYQPEDFIAGNANARALDLVTRWPDWPYSLVVVHGPQGCGKTHLCHLFARRAQATFIDPARVGTVPADQLLAGNHGWILDGLEAVADPAALAQLINHARARGDYVLMTASAPPAALASGLPDLQSRLAAMPEVALGLPDDALLAAVLAKSFADRQLRVVPDALVYAVTRLERSFAAAQHFAARVDEASLATGKRVGLAFMREMLR